MTNRRALTIDPMSPPVGREGLTVGVPVPVYVQAFSDAAELEADPLWQAAPITKKDRRMLMARPFRGTRISPILTLRRGLRMAIVTAHNPQLDETVGGAAPEALDKRRLGSPVPWRTLSRRPKPADVLFVLTMATAMRGSTPQATPSSSLCSKANAAAVRSTSVEKPPACHGGCAMPG